MDGQGLRSKKMKGSRLPAPPPTLPLLIEPEEDIQQVKARCPSFNTMQVRRPRYKKPPVPRTPSELLSGKTRSSSGKVTGGRSSATFTLKDILSQSSLEKTEEIEEARIIINAAKKESEEVGLQTSSSLSSISSPQVKFEGTSFISEAFPHHSRENLAGSFGSLEDEEDKLVQCITSLRAIAGEDSSSKLEYASDSSSGRRMTPSHIAGVRDLKAFSQKSRVEKKAFLGATSDFVYALARSSAEGKWNPYELEIVPAEKARAQEVYFTISAFSISQIDRKGHMMTTNVDRWLWERKLFNQLILIPFFSNFRIYKVLLFWKKYISWKKFNKNRKALKEELFIVDPLLQAGLVKVQDLCSSVCDMSRHTYINAFTTSSSTHDEKEEDQKEEISLIQYDSSQTLSLDQFMEDQRKRCGQARERLASLRKQIVSIVGDTVEAIGKKEGMPIENKDITVDKSVSALQVLEWRSTAGRLKRFESSCSNIIQRLLQSLVMKAINTLREGMGRSLLEATTHKSAQLEAFQASQQCVISQPFSQSVLDRMVIYMDDISEGEEQGVESGKGSRMGEVQNMEAQASCFSQFLSRDDLDSLATSDCSLKKYILKEAPPISKFPNDPLLASILNPVPKTFRPIWEVDLQLQDHKPQTGRPCGKGKKKNKTKDSGRDSLKVTVKPSLQSLQEAVDSLLSLYHRVITSFVPISKDTRIAGYTTAARFDFLTRLAEENVEKPEVIIESEWPNLASLLLDFTPYEESVLFIRNVIGETMKTVESHSKLYECYGHMVEQCVSADVGRSEYSNWTVSHFQRAFSLYHDQVHAMSNMVGSFVVGVVDVKGHAFKGHCLSYPNQLLSILNTELPNLLVAMGNQLSYDIKDATSRLVTVPTTVNAFIHFLADVEDIRAGIPVKGRTLKTITSLYNVVQHFNVDVSEQDMALYKSLFPLFRFLESAVVLAQATKSENVQSFSTDVKREVMTLLQQARDIKTQLDSPSLLEDAVGVASETLLSRLDQLRTELNSISERVKVLLEHYHEFSKIPTTRIKYHVDGSSTLWTPDDVHKEVLTVQDSLEMRKQLFTLKEEWEVKVQKWTSASIFSLHLGRIQREVTKFIRNIEFMEISLPSAVKLLKSLSSQVVDFKSKLPVLSCLLNPALRFRHWDAIQGATEGETAGEQVKLSKDMTANVADLTRMKVFEQQEVISVISNQATHEESLEKMLKKVTNEWGSRELNLVPYKGITERLTYILGGAEDLLVSLEDSLVSLSIIKASRYVAPIKHAVRDWESRLVMMLETVEYWLMCQKTWLYLENIFTTTELHRQLSTESSLFLKADRSWRETLRLIHSKPTAMKATTTPGLLEAFQACHVILEQVFKSLEDYLSSIRMVFPRFSFISDSELLDILSHPKDINVAQSYLPKLFGNIKKLELDQSQSKASSPVLAMVSAEGERVEMSRACQIRGSPEQWLARFELAMVGVVRHCMASGVSSYEAGEGWSQWCLLQPAQVAITVSQIFWTKEVEACLSSDTSSHQEALMSLYQTQLSHLEDLSRQLEGEGLSPPQQSQLASLLTLGIHDRDVILSLRGKQAQHVEDFEWTRHLRYYWIEAEKTATLRQVCTSFSYGHEYLGSLPRLVVTPLSERCYLTLSTALHLHLGASPIGPAGTGKSETVKDFAKALGRFCIIINCSEELDYKMMGRYFSGLIQSGVWCCFDEFNRIDVEVLSAVSQQLQCIKTAKDKFSKTILFEGREMSMKSSCAVFITMNPGYAGRVELPDNLKTLFRPVAMMVPDTRLICEVLFYCQCFTSASVLAHKLTYFYHSIASQTSAQHHYDFGLRSVKAVITLSGEYLKQNLVVVDRKEREKLSVMRALKDVTIPRLLAKDLLSAHLLLQDLFQDDGSTHLDDHAAKLKSYLEAAVVQAGLKLSSYQIQKCLKLYHLLNVRHGTILLGPTGGGKTTVLSLLRDALNHGHLDFYGLKKGHRGVADASASHSHFNTAQHCQLETINPKAVSVRQLYGYTDPLSLEWRNGILSRVLHLFNTQTEEDLSNSGTTNAASTADEDGCHPEHSLPSTTSTLQGSHVEEENDSKSKASSSVSFSVSPHVGEGGEGDGTAFKSSQGLPYPLCAPVGWRWVLLDGPVDSDWIENLNSVLDDSKVLCLSNGERVDLSPGSRVLFETDDLTNASPATVSRCGVLYMDPAELGWKPMVKSWLKSLPEHLDNARSHIRMLFNASMDAGLNFIRSHSSDYSYPLPATGAVRCFCFLLGGLLSNLPDSITSQLVKKQSLLATSSMDSKTDSSEANHESQVMLHGSTLSGIYRPNLSGSSQTLHMCKNWQRGGKKRGVALQSDTNVSNSAMKVISNLFVFAYVWSFGGCFERTETELLGETSAETLEGVAINFDLDQKVARGGATAREQFDALVYDIFTAKGIEASLPTTPSLIHSYYFSVSSGTFEPWTNLVPPSQEMARFMTSTRGGGIHSSSAGYLLRQTFSLFSDGSRFDATSVGVLPTVDIVRLAFLLCVLYSSQLTESFPNVSFSGSSGVGKTQLLSHLFSRLSSKTWQNEVLMLVLGSLPFSKNRDKKSQLLTRDTDDPFSLLKTHVSADMEGTALQKLLQKNIVRHGRSSLTPSKGKSLVLCLDDLHSGARDVHGSCSVHEFLRQLCGSRGWYCNKTLQWREVEGISLLATHSTSSSRTTISSRLLGRFCLFHLPESSFTSLVSIFSSHLRASFETKRFSQEVVDLVPMVTACCVFVLQEVRGHLTPSPHKPQYLFNLMDVGKVLTGLLRVRSRCHPDEATILGVLVNELARVFHDRCFPDDREKVLYAIQEGLRIHFKISKSTSHLREELTNSTYADFVDTSRGYGVVKDHRRLVKVLERAQTQWNLTEDKCSQLVLFPLACEHIVRLMRVLQLQGGHLLMIGLEGVGRRSCLQLACYVCGLHYHPLTPAHCHAPTSERVEEIKSVLIDCGVNGRPSLLMVEGSTREDPQQNVLYSLVNEVVVGGHVLELFGKEEQEGMLNRLAEVLLEEAKVPMSSKSIEELREIFTERLSRCLHVGLCFTPHSQGLAGMCRQFPGLVTHLTVDVFDEWSAKALHGVAIKHLQAKEFRLAAAHVALEKESYGLVCSVCVRIHMAVLTCLQNASSATPLSFVVTPSSFIFFLSVFCRQLVLRHRKASSKKEHLEKGLQYLAEADEWLAVMRAELQALKPRVLQMTKEVESLIQQLAEEQKEIDQLTATVFEERMAIAKETDYVTSLAQETQADLDLVLPELRAAEEGLYSIKKADLVEIRSYSSPPGMVMTVMSAVCVLLREHTEWTSIKLTMADPAHFMRRLAEYNKDKIQDKVILKLSEYTKDPNFVPERVAQYSVACQSFCQWVLALEHYHKVHKQVLPKQIQYDKVSSQLRVLLAQLQDKEQQLIELEAKMEALSVECGQKKAHKAELEEKYDDILKKLQRAEVLMESLASEQMRWKSTLAELKSKEDVFLGCVVMLSASLAYLGPFPPAQRASLLHMWQQLCEEAGLGVAKTFTLEESLGQPDIIQDWYVQGLPRDAHSVQNALMVLNVDKTPFLIDPQGQAILWLKSMLKEVWSEGVVLVDYSSPKLLDQLEQAMQLGTPAIVKGVPTHPGSLLDSVLERPGEEDNRFRHSARRLVVKLGKKEVECASSFRLYLICEEGSGHLDSSVCTKTAVINFSATQQGYQDQLLSVTTSTKEPALELQHKSLLSAISADMKQMETLEKKLLDSLQDSQGDLLDNDDLVDTLREVMSMAGEVKGRLSQAMTTSDDIAASRLKYEKVAVRGSLLYFSLQSLRLLNPLYTFSSHWFLEVFVTCLQAAIAPPNSQSSESFQLYVDELVEYLTLAVYQKVSSGILTKHFLPFAFKLCCTLFLHRDPSLASETTISKQEWAFLQLGDIPLEEKSKVTKPEEIPVESWNLAVAMEKSLPAFRGLLEHVVKNTSMWVEFSKVSAPWEFVFEEEEAGKVVDSKEKGAAAATRDGFLVAGVGRFQKLLLVKALCSQQLAAGMRWFVGVEMGVAYSTKVPGSIGGVYRSMSKNKPGLIILTPNVNPLVQLVQLAKKEKVHMETVSLGQGQGSKAAGKVSAAATRGGWVFLQNCHLAASWMSSLAQLFRELVSSGRTHANFRLWLSTKSTPYLPPVILQSSIKVCLESPSSVKAGMQQLVSGSTTDAVTHTDFDLTSEPNWKPLLYGLCLFHCAANARRSYGREGWREPYVFGVEDLQVSIRLLEQVHRGMSGGVAEGGVLSWAIVEHLLGDICYGGKVTDLQDLASLKALLSKYCHAHCCSEQDKALHRQSAASGSGYSYSDILTKISLLPDTDRTEALGLDSVLCPAVSRADSASVLVMLTQLNTTRTPKRHEERYQDSQVLEMAENLLEQLPRTIAPLATPTETGSTLTGSHTHPTVAETTGLLSPLWVLLANEVAEANQKVLAIRSCLTGVMAEVRSGVVVQEQVYEALARNTVPPDWKFGKESPSSVHDWRAWYQRHHTFVEKWAGLNRSNPTPSSPPKLPAKVWLPALTHVNGLFEALKQSYSRKKLVPVETTDMEFDTANVPKDEEVIVLQGLTLCQAQWDLERGLVSTSLVEQYSRVPDLFCWVKGKFLGTAGSPKSTTEGNQSPETNGEGFYCCPLYSSTDKLAKLATLPLRTNESHLNFHLLGVFLSLC